MNQQFFLLFLLLVSLPGWTQGGRFHVYKEDSKKRAQIRNSRKLEVFYEKLSWNQKSTEIESGYLYLKDRKTGKVIEMKLSETQPDSGVFNIEYPIGVLKLKTIEAEIYSPPQGMLKDDGRLSMAENLIEDGSVKRKPFLLRVLRQRGQIVDVFDDKEKALAAFERYKEEMGIDKDSVESESIIEVANKDKPERTKVVDSSTLQSMFLANENDLEATNEKNKELREVLRNLELKRRKTIEENAKLWSSAQEKANAKEANDLIGKGVAQLNNTNYEESMEAFLKASDLDPDDEDIYEQYGISLYRLKKYNQAIVVLDISKPTAERVDEKNYYIGMSYFQLKDYGNAVASLEKVIQNKNEAFGPTAAFYKGLSLIELQKYDEAKLAFQYVLDHSKNPEMDKRAESYIEYTLDRKSIAEKQSHWFFMDGVLGLMYDSNIVLARDQARELGLVTNEEGFRGLVQLSPRLRPYYSNSDEINIRFDFTMLQSRDEDFSTNAVAETADPIIMSLSVPWTHRGSLDGKGYFFDLAPAYEQIIMDLDGTGNATITNSIKLRFDNTLVISKSWIAKGDWFFAQNDSNILGDETSADSFSGGLRLSSIFVLNKDAERYIIPEFSYQINDAKAAIYHFNRVDIATTFTTGVFAGFIWNSRAGYYLANYESRRTDNNYTLSTGLTKRLNSHWNWGINGSYIINDSNTNYYNKHNIVTTFSFSY